jgi:Tfp pilus assembly protein PilV
MRIQARPRPRRGVTLVEVVVAVFLFTVGCLAMLSSQTAVTALRTRALAGHELALQALNTLDSLRGVSCTRVSAGTSLSPAGRLTWTAAHQSRVVSVRLSATPASGSPPWSADTLIPCAP